MYIVSSEVDMFDAHVGITDLLSIHTSVLFFLSELSAFKKELIKINHQISQKKTSIVGCRPHFFNVAIPYVQGVLIPYPQGTGPSVKPLNT